MATADGKKEEEKIDADSCKDTSPNTTLMAEKDDVKMAGYLEKRGKMKLLSTWKRYWFVLEGRLLLYYRSQLEYLNLSACKGSLNMGIASCVRPVAGPGFMMEVITRTHAITLRTKDRAVQEQWLQALLDSMALPNLPSPLRILGGPLHFKYSMDNLPTVEEMEKLENKVEDRQGTLPRQPKPQYLTRRESVLMRIKNLGGRSYGGSLDTVLRIKVGNQAQQPKIPRIKAVDRMLGFHSRQELKEPSDAEEWQENAAELNKKIIEISADSSSTTPDIHSNELNSQSPQETESLSATDLQTSHSTAMHSAGMMVEIKTVKEPDEKTASNSVSPELKVESVGNVKRTFDASTPDMEVTRPDHISRDLVKCNENENSLFVDVENQLYLASQEESTGYEFTKAVGEILHNSKISGPNGSNEGHLEQECKPIPREREILDDPEDEYYSNYDNPSTIQFVEDLKNISEPTLPPRPSVSSPELPDEPDYVEYNAYCEPEIQSEPLSSKSEEKKKKLKLKLQRKKSATKESVILENGSNNKKRKLSFLKKMLKHYRKKAEVDEEVDDEPEYYTVDCSSVLPDSESPKTTDNGQRRGGDGLEEEEEEVFVHKNKLFGTATLLPTNTLQELHLKLKERGDDATKQADHEKRKHATDDLEKIVTKSLPTEEPNDCNDKDSSNEAAFCFNFEERPQLPPRRARRPSSPWHDIPTNNSPVSGNFNFQSISNMENKTNEYDLEYNQDVQDEMLGTPEGYTYLQKKWKAVERSGEWHRELRQVAFPANARSPGSKVLKANKDEELILDQNNDGEIECKSEKNVGNKTFDPVSVNTVDIYSKINKTNDETGNKVPGKVCSKEFCVKVLHVTEQKTEKKSDMCIVDNVNYVPYFTSNKNSVALLTFEAENSRSETFQKDSLMTSICTNTHSDLEDSIISVNINESKVVHSCSDNGNTSVLLKSENSVGTKHSCTLNGHTEEINSVNSDNINCFPIQPLKEGEIKSNSNKLLREVAKDVTVNRYSDELNQLLAQLAEITSAPLLSPGATKSLIDFPECNKTTYFQDLSLSDQITLLGPIRRRRHSEPDYDIPRPHNSLMQVKKIFTPTTVQLPEVSEDQDSSITKDMDQGHLSWTLSMAPDSLEPVPQSYVESSDSQNK